MEGYIMKEFVAKYREVKVQNLREKNMIIQYRSAQGEEGECNTMFMGTDSLSRRRSEEARSRRESNTRI